MTDQSLFNISFAAYAISCGLYLAYAINKKEGLAKSAFGIIIFAILFHIISLIVRTVIAQGMLPVEHKWYVPWSNWFESFSLFALVTSIIFIAIQWKDRLPILGAFVLPLTMIVLTVALFGPGGKNIPRLAPALQSYWMAIHVPVMFISYAAFTNAFAVCLAYLIQERQIKSKKPAEISFQLPPLDHLDRTIYIIIAFSFPVLTLGIGLGAVWAYDAWGAYWQWDPKETWALITWFVYLIYLHLRLYKGWRGRKSAYVCIAGFAVMIFTYVGVNYLSDLHGFLSGEGR